MGYLQQQLTSNSPRPCAHAADYKRPYYYWESIIMFRYDNRAYCTGQL